LLKKTSSTIFIEGETIDIQMKRVLLVAAGEMLTKIHMRAAQDGVKTRCAFPAGHLDMKRLLLAITIRIQLLSIRALREKEKKARCA